MRRQALTVFFFAVLLATGAGGATSVAGRIWDSVACKDEPSQRYVLYVPSSYSKEALWPVIFCFEPSARGRIPVERMQAAAEKYGYILAASLNSRNGPLPANAAAAHAMIKDVSSHLSIDPRRVYTAGMSGGARVATAIALSGQIRGVIACGAGFPVLEDGLPSQIKFAFLGVVGIEDFNYGELLRLDGELDERKATHGLLIFDGTHAWPAEATLTEAIEWLELDAMRAGLKPPDESFVTAVWEKRMAELSRASGVVKWRLLKGLAADFSGLREVGDYARQAADLGKSREVKVALKSEKALLAREADLIDELGNAAMGGVTQKQRLAASMLQRANTAGNPAERHMYQRAIAGYCSIARETARDSMAAKDYARAVELLELVVALRPDNSRAYFDLARARASKGESAAALAALERAAAAGFDDVAKLDGEPAFVRLKDDARWAALREKARASAHEPAIQLPALRISAVMSNVELRPVYRPANGPETPTILFLRVEHVHPNSAAALAGVEQGQEITAIQGHPVEGCTESELGEILAQPAGVEIQLALRDTSLLREKLLRIPVPARRTAQTVPAGAE